jgi:hypothetical protein
MSLTKVTYSMIAGESVSVADYIPVGTNTATTDCAAFIQAAIDSGKSVFVPAGTYRCSGITLDNAGQIFYGEGATKTVLRDATSADTVILITAEYVTVRDLRCLCANTPTTAGVFVPVGIKTSGSCNYANITNVHSDGFALCIQIEAGIRVTVEKCRVNVGEFSYYGIGITGGGEITLDNNSVFDASGDKFAGVGLIYNFNSPANVITNNYISRGRAPGIYVDAPVGGFSNNLIFISDNDIDYIFNWAIFVNNFKQIHINNNWCSCGQRWNDVAPASGANVYQGATGQIQIRDSLDFYITNNDVYQSQGQFGGATAITPSESSNGIRIFNSDFGIVLGNTIDNSDNATLCESGCSQIQFMGNIIGQLAGLSNQGTPMSQGFVDDGSSVGNVYTSNIVNNLNAPVDASAYINIDSFTVPDVNKVTAWTNLTYETFISTRANVSAAIETGVQGVADTNFFPVAAGKYYQVTAFLVLNSGTAPAIGVYDGANSGFDVSPTALTAGLNVFTYKASVTGSSAHVVLSNVVATNFSVNCKVQQISF